MENWFFFDYSRGLAALALLLAGLLILWVCFRWRKDFLLQAAAGVGFTSLSVFVSHIAYLYKEGLVSDGNLWVCGCGYDELVLWILFVIGVTLLLVFWGSGAGAASALSMAVVLWFIPMSISPVWPLLVVVFSLFGRWSGLLIALLNCWVLYWEFNVKIDDKGWLYLMGLLPIITLFVWGRWDERDE